MATISVQTKKFADLEAILSVTGTEQMLIHDGNGVKVITVENLCKGLQTDIDAIQNVIADGAGAHNSIYRGKTWVLLLRQSSTRQFPMVRLQVCMLAITGLSVV